MLLLLLFLCSVYSSEEYWKQMAEDLEAYAIHAHRKTIDESDIELLMRRWVSVIGEGVGHV